MYEVKFTFINEEAAKVFASKYGKEAEIINTEYFAVERKYTETFREHIRYLITECKDRMTKKSNIDGEVAVLKVLEALHERAKAHHI